MIGEIVQKHAHTVLSQLFNDKVSAQLAQTIAEGATPEIKALPLEAFATAVAGPTPGRRRKATRKKATAKKTTSKKKTTRKSASKKASKKKASKKKTAKKKTAKKKTAKKKTAKKASSKKKTSRKAKRDVPKETKAAVKAAQRVLVPTKAPANGAAATA